MRKTLAETQIDQIHELYLDGVPLVKIAKEVGIPLPRVKAQILKYRTLDPAHWPERISSVTIKALGLSKDDTLVNVIQHSCTQCGLNFHVELSSELLNCRIACPICTDDEGVETLGPGLIFVGSLETESILPRKNVQQSPPVEIKGPSTKPAWKEEERAYLCFFYKNMSKKSIAKHLGRTYKAVASQYQFLKDENREQHYYLMGKRLYEEGTISLEGLG